MEAQNQFENPKNNVQPARFWGSLFSVRALHVYVAERDDIDNMRGPFIDVAEQQQGRP